MRLRVNIVMFRYLISESFYCQFVLIFLTCSGQNNNSQPKQCSGSANERFMLVGTLKYHRLPASALQVWGCLSRSAESGTRGPEKANGDTQHMYYMSATNLTITEYRMKSGCTSRQEADTWALLSISWQEPNCSSIAERICRASNSSCRRLLSVWSVN